MWCLIVISETSCQGLFLWRYSTYIWGGITFMTFRLSAIFSKHYGHAQYSLRVLYFMKCVKRRYYDIFVRVLCKYKRNINLMRIYWDLCPKRAWDWAYVAIIVKWHNTVYWINIICASKWALNMSLNVFSLCFHIWIDFVVWLICLVIKLVPRCLKPWYPYCEVTLPSAEAYGLN